MKKAVIAVIFILCGAGVFFWLQSKQGETVSAADCLPADVLFYAEQHEFSTMYQTFLESRLGRTLTRLDYEGIAAQIGEPGNDLMTVVTSLEEITKVLVDPAFDEILGKEFSLALFPANSFAADNPARVLEERLLIIARPQHGAGLVKLLAPLLSKDIEQSTVQYGSHTITRYSLDKENTLSTAYVGGLLLAGLEERLVRKSLDYYDSRENTLASNSDFKRLRSGFQGAQLFSYLSIPSLLKQGRVIAKALPDGEKKEFLGLLKEWDGWGAVAYGGWHEKDRVRDKAEILFDRALLDKRVAKLVDVKPVKNKTLTFVPRDALLYYWTNTLNLPLVWELFSTGATRQQPQAIEILRRELRNSADVELEDVLGMIDTEFGVIVKEGGREGVPLPKVSLIVQLRQPEKFMKIFRVLLDNADIPVSEKEYNGQSISYWGVAPQDGLQPAYALVGNYLLIANSLDLVEQLSDLHADPASSLARSPIMKAFGENLLKDNNSVTYVHIAKLADSLKEMASWAASMAVLQGPDAARSADVIVNQLLLPFLDGVAIYTQMGSHSIIGEDSIVLESVTTTVQ